ncbi:MAG: hypothetical protein QXO47_10110 [Thermoproteota archaeon]
MVVQGLLSDGRIISVNSFSTATTVAGGTLTLAISVGFPDLRKVEQVSLLSATTTPATSVSILNTNSIALNTLGITLALAANASGLTLTNALFMAIGY